MEGFNWNMHVFAVSDRRYDKHNIPIFSTSVELHYIYVAKYRNVFVVSTITIVLLHVLFTPPLL